MIPNTAFELRVSNHMFDTTKNITGKYQASGQDAEASAGLFVKQATRLPNEGYTGVLNENAWYMNAAADGTGDVYACNTFDVQMLAGPDGNYYKVGRNTLGLPIPSGMRGTYTRIDLGDIFRVGVGNFAAAPSEGATVATIGTGGLLTAGSAAPEDAGTLYFEILETGNFTVGAYNGFAYYLLRARRVEMQKEGENE